MKLFWSTRSPFVRFVMVVAHEKGIADQIETEQVVVAAAKPNATVMAHNPLNKLPTLVLDDGSALFDSRVIAEYFDETGTGARLLPTSGAARRDVLRQMALGIGVLDLLVGWLAEHRKPAAEQDTAFNAAMCLKFAAALDVLEDEAAGLSARDFDMAHAAIGAALGYADFRYDDIAWRDDRPALATFHDVVAARASFQATGHRDEY
ncbi:MAG: glutathione S-transferase N-terminal domain-containing protein [Hyphomicrobiaceae bacterium]